MQRGEREVNCRGEGEERERKRESKGWRRRTWIPLGRWKLQKPKASKTNQVRLTPPPYPEKMDVLKEKEQTSLGIHNFGGGWMEKLCLLNSTALQGEIKLGESFSGHL